MQSDSMWPIRMWTLKSLSKNSIVILLQLEFDVDFGFNCTGSHVAAHVPGHVTLLFYRMLHFEYLFENFRANCLQTFWDFVDDFFKTCWKRLWNLFWKLFLKTCFQLPRGLGIGGLLYFVSLKAFTCDGARSGTRNAFVLSYVVLRYVVGVHMWWRTFRDM